MYFLSKKNLDVSLKSAKIVAMEDCNVQFPMPLPGQKIRVTVDWSDYLKNHTKSTPRKYTYIGTVLPRSETIFADCFALTTDNKNFPAREVKLERVIALSIITDDLELKQEATVNIPVKPHIRTFDVRGSKGAIYKIEKAGTIYTCTCTGFTFRKHCKHINQVQEIIMKENEETD